jgi:hypothetical protein
MSRPAIEEHSISQQTGPMRSSFSYIRNAAAQKTSLTGVQFVGSLTELRHD